MRRDIWNSRRNREGTPRSASSFRSAITTTYDESELFVGLRIGQTSPSPSLQTEASFSMHAKTVSMVKSPHCKPRGIGHPLARNQNATQDAATANRCETTEGIANWLDTELLPCLHTLPDLPIDCFTTVSRLPVSIYRPTAGDKKNCRDTTSQGIDGY